MLDLYWKTFGQPLPFFIWICMGNFPLLRQITGGIGTLTAGHFLLFRLQTLCKCCHRLKKRGSYLRTQNIVCCPLATQAEVFLA